MGPAGIRCVGLPGYCRGCILVGLGFEGEILFLAGGGRGRGRGGC